MKLYYLISIIIFSFLYVTGQTISFEKIIDFDGNIEGAESVIIENDGYVICGYGSDQDFSGYYVIRLIKLDLYGNIMWSSKVGKDSTNFYSGASGSLKKSWDGGYIIGGGIRKIQNSDLDAVLIRFSMFGDTIFTKYFGGLNDDIGLGCMYTPHNDIVLIGYSKSFGNNSSDYYLVKTDSSGNLIFEETYGSSGIDRGINVLLTHDNNLLLSGGASVFNNKFQAYLVKTDMDGNVIWDKSFGDNYTTCGAYINHTRDSGYIFSSCTDSIMSGTDFTYSITKIDSNGNIQWKKIFPQTQYHDILMVREISSGGYIFCGRMDDKILGNTVGWVVKLDFSGNAVWERRYAHKSEFFFYGELWDIHPTLDSGYIAVGSTVNNSEDIWVLKLDSLGCIDGYCGLTDTNCYYQPWPCVPDTTDSCLTPPCDTVSVSNIHAAIHNLIEIFPNPTFEKINISTTCNACIFYLYNQLGQSVFTTRLSAEMQTIDVSELPYGLYLYIAKNQQGAMQTGKLIIGR